jgi:lysophospholipase L1-like esterase
MRRLSSPFLALLLLGLSAACPLETPAGGGEDFDLALPAELYAAPGEEMCVYFDNTICTQIPEAYKFIVTCPLGKTEAVRWRVKPLASQAGAHPFTLEVKDQTGKKSLAKKTVRLVVAGRTPSRKTPRRLLLVGDSLTQAGVYATELVRLLDEPGNGNWVLLGSRELGERVRHEGYSGWRWGTFLTHYPPDPDAAAPKGRSPFLYANAKGDPELDIERYIREVCGGIPPDVILFLLGTNDISGAARDPDNDKAVRATLDELFKNSDTLVKAFRKAAPGARIGLCLNPPCNARETAFVLAYKGGYSRWNWKRAQVLLVHRQIREFSGREAEGVFVVPTHLNLDPVAGFPEIDAVHPNADGYKQIAASLYSWLKNLPSEVPAPAGLPQLPGKPVPSR